MNLQGVGSLGLGESRRYSLWGSYSPGTVEVSSSAEWISLTPALLKMDKGVATGIAPGAARIQATLVSADGTFVATKDVEVLAAPPTPPANMKIGDFCASLYIIGEACPLQVQTSNLPNITEFASWTSSNPLVASVTGSFITPRSVGVTDLTATYSGVSAVLRVTVLAPVGITVTSPFQTIYVGQAVRPRATAQFSDGAEKVVSEVASWSSSQPSVVSATSGSSSAMTGVSSGTADVVATYASATGSFRVTVIPTAVDTLVIAPPTIDPWGGALVGGGSGSFGLTVNYVIASAPTATVSLYVRDQNGVDLSTDPFTLPRSAELPAGQGFRSLFVHFNIPAGTTMLCPSAVLWAGAATVATAPCRTIK